MTIERLKEENEILTNELSRVARELERVEALYFQKDTEVDRLTTAIDNTTKQFLKLHDEYQRAMQKNRSLKMIINSVYREFQNHPKDSEPSEPHSEPPQKEYGCTVCKHSETCEPNIFGVCNKFERIEK